MILETFSSLGEAANSPFIVPVAGCLMILGIVAVTSWSGSRTRELESQERLAAIAKGLVPPPTAAELALSQAPRPAANAFRRRANVRLTGIILLSSAVALALFFVVLWLVLGVREILSGVACALIPFGIGVGFLIDARIQSREIDEATPPPANHSFTS
jgi:Flp pilus assembly protein TadB